MADRTRTVRKRRAQIVVLVLGYLAVAHFAVGLYHTFRLVLFSDAHAAYFWFSLPYIGITGIFVASIVLGHVRRFRWSAVTLVVGLIVSAAACLYDVKNQRYQIHITGAPVVRGPVYVIWWWYYEPFWHGYEPGNV